jgi:Cu(I)/Ag(I) efflux system membrane fusion protein
VLVELGGGAFEPREVELGSRGDGYVEVTGGLAAGERVVVNGNFLIDAESNFKSALGTLGDRAADPHAGH